MNLRFKAGKSPICLRRRLEVCLSILWILLPFQLLAGETSSLQRLYPDATLSLAAFVNQGPVAAVPDVPNAPLPAPLVPDAFLSRLTSSNLPASLIEFLGATNVLPRDDMSEAELEAHLKQRLEIARYYRASRQPNEAEPILSELLTERSPEVIQQSALLELAALAQDQNNLVRAQQIYSQFLSKWANDLRVPEILLRQGLLFRRMGLYNLALTKYYAVMTSALALKNDQFDYYVRLVLDAQTQIAETHYELGKYAEAADFFSRLLKQNNAAINKPQVLYRLTRCHSALGKYADAVADAQDFLLHYPDAPEQPEIRFHLAVGLKEIGRDNESLQQVLLLLQEQRALTKHRPEIWAYWQQRAGNLIANQLYREGDYSKALEIYLNLAQLDTSAAWQLPLKYQIGMTYERLWQPQKATDTYTEILNQEKQIGTNGTPGLKTLLDMARWRINFIQWQGKAEAANRQLHLTNRTVTASLPERSIGLP